MLNQIFAGRQFEVVLLFICVGLSGCIVDNFERVDPVVGESDCLALYDDFRAWRYSNSEHGWIVASNQVTCDDYDLAQGRIDPNGHIIDEVTLSNREGVTSVHSLDGMYKGPNYFLKLDASNIPRGIYTVKLQGGHVSRVLEMKLVRPAGVVEYVQDITDSPFDSSDDLSITGTSITHEALLVGSSGGSVLLLNRQESKKLEVGLEESASLTSLPGSLGGVYFVNDGTLLFWDRVSTNTVYQGAQKILAVPRQRSSALPYFVAERSDNNYAILQAKSSGAVSSVVDSSTPFLGVVSEDDLYYLDNSTRLRYGNNPELETQLDLPTAVQAEQMDWAFELALTENQIIAKNSSDFYFFDREGNRQDMNLDIDFSGSKNTILAVDGVWSLYENAYEFVGYDGQRRGVEFVWDTQTELPFKVATGDAKNSFLVLVRDIDDALLLDVASSTRHYQAHFQLENHYVPNSGPDGETSERSKPDMDVRTQGEDLQVLIAYSSLGKIMVFSALVPMP